MDVDGTLIAEEDWSLGKGSRLRRRNITFTSQVMRGELNFETSLPSESGFVKRLSSFGLYYCLQPFICPEMLKNLSPISKEAGLVSGDYGK